MCSTDNVTLLAYVMQHGGVSDAAQLTEMLYAACLSNSFKVAKWLRQQGAEWPTELENRYNKVPYAVGITLHLNGHAVKDAHQIHHLTLDSSFKVLNYQQLWQLW